MWQGWANLPRRNRCTALPSCAAAVVLWGGWLRMLLVSREQAIDFILVIWYIHFDPQPRLVESTLHPADPRSWDFTSFPFPSIPHPSMHPSHV